jgi:hypothetical protein
MTHFAVAAADDDRKFAAHDRRTVLTAVFSKSSSRQSKMRAAAASRIAGVDPAGGQLLGLAWTVGEFGAGVSAGPKTSPTRHTGELRHHLGGRRAPV